MIIRNARVITLDARNRVLENAAVRIGADGAIAFVGETAAPAPSEEIVDAGGRLLMPALINCHTHLYSTLARGIALPGNAPKN